MHKPLDSRGAPRYTIIMRTKTNPSDTDPAPICLPVPRTGQTGRSRCWGGYFSRVGRTCKILIVRLSAIGDVINTLPVLGVLRNNFSESYLAWVVEDKAQSLLKPQPQLNQVLVFERKKWQKAIRSVKGFFNTLSEVLDFIRVLRKAKFDVVLDFQGNLKSGLITWLSRAPLRVGFGKGFARELNYLFTNCKITLDHSRINRVEKNLSLLKGLGLNVTSAQWPSPDTPLVYITSEEQDEMNNFLRQQGLGDQPYIVFHPGTSHFGSYKRWPLDNYARLGDRLMEVNNHLNILLTWGSGEQWMVQEISQKMKVKKPVIACVTDSITQLAGLLVKARAFVGSDSAPLHLANVLKIPSVALFGPKDPVIYGPYFKHRSTIIRKDIPCSPCQKRTCKPARLPARHQPDTRPNGGSSGREGLAGWSGGRSGGYPDCMNLITVEEVFQAVQRLLNSNPH